jgi:hypothetical protein
MTRPILRTDAPFARVALDKVERLLEVLDTFHSDPVLGDAFVLHGGTALNVFLDDLPRLSVDVDVLYVRSADAAGMLRERPVIDGRLREVAGKLGYGVRATADEHAGRTYRLHYGNDSLKVDVNYLARVPLLEPLPRTCTFADPPTTYPVLDPSELAAGKLKALVARVAARDLYDLSRVAARSPRLLENPLARALMLRAISAAEPFPMRVDPVAALARFDALVGGIVDPLRAMLAAGDEPDFAEMRADVEKLLLPLKELTSNEAEYLRLMGEEATYRPELLFEQWPEVLRRARLDPVMEWKVLNLRKRPRA